MWNMKPRDGGRFLLVLILSGPFLHLDFDPRARNQGSDSRHSSSPEKETLSTFAYFLHGCQRKRYDSQVSQCILYYLDFPFSESWAQVSRGAKMEIQRKEDGDNQIYCTIPLLHFVNRYLATKQSIKQELLGDNICNSYCFYPRMSNLIYMQLKNIFPFPNQLT